MSIGRVDCKIQSSLPTLLLLQRSSLQHSPKQIILKFYADNFRKQYKKKEKALRKTIRHARGEQRENKQNTEDKQNINQIGAVVGNKLGYYASISYSEKTIKQQQSTILPRLVNKLKKKQKLEKRARKCHLQQAEQMYTDTRIVSQLLELNRVRLKHVNRNYLAPIQKYQHQIKSCADLQRNPIDNSFIGKKKNLASFDPPGRSNPHTKFQKTEDRTGREKSLCKNKSLLQPSQYRSGPEMALSKHYNSIHYKYNFFQLQNQATPNFCFNHFQSKSKAQSLNRANKSDSQQVKPNEVIQISPVKGIRYAPIQKRDHKIQKKQLDKKETIHLKPIKSRLVLPSLK